MQKYIYVLIIIPFISYSQIGVGIAGHSHFSTGQTMLPTNNSDFEVVNYELRNNSVSIDWNTGRRLIIGEVWCVLAMTYNIKQIHYFTETYSLDYELTERRMIPSLALQYVLMRRGFFKIYSSLGSYVMLANLNLNQENNTNIDLSVYEYNGLIPFIRGGIQLNTGNFTINPFVSYEFQTIYFDNFSEISSSALRNSIKNAGIRTGIRFGILF